MMSKRGSSESECGATKRTRTLWQKCLKIRPDDGASVVVGRRATTCPAECGKAAYRAKGRRFSVVRRREEHTVQQTNAILTTLSQMARKPEVKFDKLFQKLYNIELWLLAYQSIAPEPGNMTAGVDGKTIDGAGMKLIQEAIADLKASRYKPIPVRRVYIPKPNGKQRPLGIPGFREKLLGTVLKLILEAIYEPTFSENSHGFRPGRSCHTALEAIQRDMQGVRWWVEGDIKGYFDAISHEWLLTHIPMEKAILKKWLKAGYLEQSILYPTEAGTPQGGIISPVLANMTLDGLERMLMQHFPKVKTAGGALVNFVRYTDDFLVTGRTKELLEQEVKPRIEEFLRERGLQLSPEKTIITPIEEGFDFLGQNVRKYQTGKRHKLLITPSKKNVKTFLEKTRTIVKANKALSAGKLIEKLNPMIRGWANYHRHIISNKAFSSVDAMIYQAIRRWMNRRHRGKSEAWKTKKYFTTIQGDNWVFFGTVEEHPRYLLRATNVPIVRHVKIQGEANPYDPAWESYFEKRLDVQMEATLKGNHWLHTLWKH